MFYSFIIKMAKNLTILRIEQLNLTENPIFLKNTWIISISVFYLKMLLRVTWRTRIFRKLVEINKFPFDF